MPLQHKFEELISGYINDTYGISDHFLNETLVKQLTEHLLQLYNQNQFHAAGMGNEKTINHNLETRGDSIYWLDAKHNNVFEKAFLSHMEEFIKYLNNTCQTGINACEFHFARYSAGSFYKKHLDQFKSNDSRQYSMITYLNPNWQTSDGGQLALHLPKGIKHIAPTLGKTIFFKSNEMLHEVEINKHERLSITGWLKRG